MNFKKWRGILTRVFLDPARKGSKRLGVVRIASELATAAGLSFRTAVAPLGCAEDERLNDGVWTMSALLKFNLR